MLSLKHGVRLANLSPQILLGVLCAHSIFERHGHEMVITSGSDGVHSSNSRHYTGNAVDLRIRDLPASTVVSIVRALVVSLGNDFDVVHEDTHIHLEYDPKLERIKK